MKCRKISATLDSRWPHRHREAYAIPSDGRVAGYGTRNLKGCGQRLRHLALAAIAAKKGDDSKLPFAAVSSPDASISTRVQQLRKQQQQAATLAAQSAAAAFGSPLNMNLGIDLTVAPEEGGVTLAVASGLPSVCA